MKYTIRLIMLVLILVMFNTINANYKVPNLGYGLSAGGAWGDNAGDQEDWVPRVRGNLQLKLSPILLTQFGVSYTRLKANHIYKTESVITDVRLLISPNQMKQMFPFFYGGIGCTKDMSNSTTQDLMLLVPIGLGVQSKIGDQLGLQVSGGYNLVLSDKFDGRVRSGNDKNRFTGGKQDGFFEIMIGLQYFLKSDKPTTSKNDASSNITIYNTESKINDSDFDGLTNDNETNLYKTNPDKADSDNDGLKDGDEVLKYKTDPLKADSDNDGLKDGAEVSKYLSDPLKTDSDGDGLVDGLEITKYLSDPNKIDSDGDGLNDKLEVLTYNTNPNKIDTDGGGMNDGAEINSVKNPLDSKDDLFDLTKGKKIVLVGINFEFNKATILPESETILEKVRASMELNKDVTVIISGHSDNVGDRNYNQNLSLKRAQAVKDWLSDKRILANRMKVVGMGNNESIASNDTEEGRAENRRIEFTVE